MVSLACAAVNGLMQTRDVLDLCEIGPSGTLSTPMRLIPRQDFCGSRLAVSARQTEFALGERDA
jgi:hypothetical protein